MSKIAVFPGSFDPITKGHESIINRAIPLFDKIIVAVGINSEKKYFYSLEKRIQSLETVFKNQPKVEIASYSGLTVDFCKKANAKYILRGLRTTSDFEYERAIAQMNKSMMNELETIFMVATPEFSSISSTIIRNIIINGGDATQFVPNGVSLK